MDNQDIQMEIPFTFPKKCEEGIRDNQCNIISLSKRRTIEEQSACISKEVPNKYRQKKMTKTEMIIQYADSLEW